MKTADFYENYSFGHKILQKPRILFCNHEVYSFDQVRSFKRKTNDKSYTDSPQNKVILKRHITLFGATGILIGISILNLKIFMSMYPRSVVYS